MEIWQYCNVLCPMQGENKNTCFISICYNLFTAGGVSLQGEFSCTQVVIIKKGKNIEAYRLIDFDDG